MPDLLFELRSEDVPARTQRKAAGFPRVRNLATACGEALLLTVAGGAAAA